MANFVIDFLEFNKRELDRNKEIVFSDENYFGNKWIYENLGIIVIITHALLITLVAFIMVVTLPLAFAMWIIDVLYNFSKLILGTTYFFTRHIKRSIESHERYLNEKNPYYLLDKGRQHDWHCIVLDVNMEDFIIKFFKQYNSTYDTYDSKTHNLICRRYRRRSIGDTYLICKNYFPDTNLDEVLKCLIRLVKTNVLAVSKCSEIKKYVFVKKDDYTGNYQLQDLEFIKGINFEQLIAYYERNGGLS